MEGVISLGVGEPDFITPWSVREACILSLEQGYTSYTANAGLWELRKEISDYVARRFHVLYDPADEIIVTVGASQALDVSLRAILNPGDEVIVVEPSFVSYAPLVSLAGGVPIPIQTSGKHQFKLQPEQIEQVVTPKTKALIICSPNNPTGTVLNAEELAQIARIVEKHDLLVISDEIYAELCYEEQYTSFPAIDRMRERTILINGFSKGFAMTGWRLGFIAAPRELATAMLKIHQYTMMCAPTMAQYAAIEALQNGAADVEQMKKAIGNDVTFCSIIKRNRSFLPYAGRGILCISVHSVNRHDIRAVCGAIIVRGKVAVVPGHVFGVSGEGYIRCSYASSLEQLQEAIRRMKRFLERL